MIYNVTSVSGRQQSDSVVHIYLFFFRFVSLNRFLQNTEYSSLCCAVGPCWLCILHTVVWIFISNFSLPPSPLVAISLGSMPVRLFLCVCCTVVCVWNSPVLTSVAAIHSHSLLSHYINTLQVIIIIIIIIIILLMRKM